MRKPVEERYWPKVDRSGGPDACWPWTAHRMKSGYGLFAVPNGTSYAAPHLAHRVSWALVNGPIPDGLFVCHSCDNPPCCNPSHLFLGTPQDNARDMQAKGRAVIRRGESATMAKLTTEQAREVRRRARAGESPTRLGDEFGVSDTLVQRIRDGLAWRHLP